MPPQTRRFAVQDPHLNELLECGLATLEYHYPKSNKDKDNASIRTGSGLGSSTYTSTSRMTTSTTVTNASRGGFSTGRACSSLSECQCVRCRRMRSGRHHLGPIPREEAEAQGTINTGIVASTSRSRIANTSITPDPSSSGSNQAPRYTTSTSPATNERVNNPSNRNITGRLRAAGFSIALRSDTPGSNGPRSTRSTWTTTTTRSTMTSRTDRTDITTRTTDSSRSRWSKPVSKIKAWASSKSKSFSKAAKSVPQQSPARKTSIDKKLPPLPPLPPYTPSEDLMAPSPSDTIGSAGTNSSTYALTPVLGSSLGISTTIPFNTVMTRTQTVSNG